MTLTFLAWIAGLSFLALCISSIAAKVLENFPRHDLENYCKTRDLESFFDDVMEHHEAVAHGAEMFKTLLQCIFLISCSLIVFRFEWVDDQVGWQIFAACVFGGAMILATICVWIPSAVVQFGSVSFIRSTWWFWKGLNFLLRPLKLCYDLIAFLSRRLAGEEEEEEEEEFEDEFRSMVVAGEKEGFLEEEEAEMIEAVIEMDEKAVTHIMTPRKKIEALCVDDSWDDMLEFIIKTNRSRIPVYGEGLDEMVGILLANDVLNKLAKRPADPPKSFRHLLKPPWFVPETTLVDELLKQFRTRRFHLAIVVDEFRTVIGVVTIEDVIEEIVGEIEDEYDKIEAKTIVAIDNRRYSALGETHIEDLNEELGIELPTSDDFDTISGLLMNRIHDIPKVGEVAQYDGILIKVTKADQRSVHEVNVVLAADSN